MNEIQNKEVYQGLNKLYANVTEILANARKRAYTAVNFAMVESYWLIGQQIVEHEQHGEARANYGKGLLKELAARLTTDFGKGFDESNLRYMRLFYRCFPKRDTEAADSVWSTRQMDRQISTLYYERLLASKEKETVVAEANEKLKEVAPTQFIRDPFVLEFLDLKDYPALHESDIEQALIDHLQQFLLELGRGFCFVGRQRRMRYDDEDFYVDLVFYHSILKCHVLIDLKLGKLTHEDVGQMDSYIRMWDALYKNEDDNPTLGIILCSQKSEAIVKYSVLSEGKQLFASRYKLYLPTEEEFKRMLESIE